MELEYFLMLGHPERYDFRKEIMEFQTDDVIQRYHTYKAVGIAEEDKVKNLCETACVEKYGLQGLKAVLKPGCEADGCELLQAICTRLWDEKHLKYCVKAGGGFSSDTMNSAFATLSKWLSTQEICVKGVWSNRKIMDCYLDGRFPKVEDSDAPVISFLEACYTLGNFLPVPPAFQSRGMNASKDYWDLALACIYNYYMEKGKNWSDGNYMLDWLLKKKQIIEACQEWLNTFESWQVFVEKNYLQDFVHLEPGYVYGPPMELWKGHFSGLVEPKVPKQCEEFFTHASTWILSRGERMVDIARKEPVGESVFGDPRGVSQDR